jgi:hypothetical protein
VDLEMGRPVERPVSLYSSSLLFQLCVFQGFMKNAGPITVSLLNLLLQFAHRTANSKEGDGYARI